VLRTTYLDGAGEVVEGPPLREGKVRMELESGDRFEGTVDAQGRKSGFGKYTWGESSAVYEGEYSDDKKHGKGRYEYPNGDVFEGIWSEGSKNGKGTETFGNGDVFEGEFRNDNREGPGVYTYASGAVLSGTWERDEFVDGSWTYGDKRMSRRSFLKAIGKRVSGVFKKPKRPLGVIISGAPASGKGTQCEFIRETFGLVHLSTGDMLRAAVAAGTELGKKAKALMESGQLVPDDVVIGAVKERLSQSDVQDNGFLLDGFPRTAAQAEALNNLGFKIDVFVMLNVPDEALVERVVGRRIDPETGNSYHIDFNPPPPEIEDRVIQRADDTEEKVKVRLEGFHKNIDSIQEFYEDVIAEIDGTQAKEKVWTDIKKILDKAKADAK